MSNKMWESLVEHAKTCVLSGKHYVYYASDTRNVGAIFNNIYEFTGLIADDQFISAENLTENQRVSVLSMPFITLHISCQHLIVDILWIEILDLMTADKISWPPKIFLLSWSMNFCCHSWLECSAIILT